jgi:valyl-tRNA synthetase
MKSIIINTPPPTISGNLHIGHIFSYTHIDCFARATKFLGNNVKFPIGFDCNGLPTENLLRKSDKSIDDYCQDYLNLFKKMGFQMDFDNYYKTIDFDANKFFSILFEKGVIYEAEKETWFDEALQTPLADCEVVEKDGVMIGEVSKKPVVKRLSKQFFLKTLKHKTNLLKLAKKIEFYPPQMQNRLIDWIENLNQDWCISRDRTFGIKISNSQKVFDTWFISALTHCQYSKQADFHFQSHEIIRSWCFYSLVMAYHLNNGIPFKKVFISGWCIGKDGQKFSKSAGNFIDPSKLIDAYGVNPIRFWAIKANWGADTYFDENVILNGRRLIVKFENAKRFFVLRDAKAEPTKLRRNLTQEFKAILETYNLSKALDFLYKEFFNFCDDKIEKCKTGDQDINKNFNILLEFEKMFLIFFNLNK